jgi:hypothetical protein
MSTSNPIMNYFAYKHLPPHLQEVSKPIGELAEEMNARLPDGPEKSAGLRKLLEAKDCLVRAALPPFVFILVLLSAMSADACQKCGLLGNKCALRQNVVVQQVVTPQVYYGAPQINYFVGQQVRVEAIVQQALQQDPEFAEFQRFKMWRSLAEQPATKPAEPITPASVLLAKCGQCHSGATPKGGITIDGVTAMSCELKLKALRAVADGKMPPKDKLAPEDAGDVLQELIRLPELKP